MQTKASSHVSVGRLHSKFGMDDRRGDRAPSPRTETKSTGHCRARVHPSIHTWKLVACVALFVCGFHIRECELASCVRCVPTHTGGLVSACSLPHGYTICDTCHFTEPPAGFVRAALASCLTLLICSVVCLPTYSIRTLPASSRACIMTVL